MAQDYTILDLAEALQALLNVEQYLYRTTYASDGKGSRTWSQWYADINDSVELLRTGQTNARYAIARRIGATLED